MLTVTEVFDYIFRFIRYLKSLVELLALFVLLYNVSILVWTTKSTTVGIKCGYLSDWLNTMFT